MITVSILINNQPIFTRSARNQSVKNKKGQTLYTTDCDTDIWHDSELGAIPLVKKMLDCINDEMKTNKDWIYLGKL
jgi:hypothetical protein